MTDTKSAPSLLAYTAYDADGNGTLTEIPRHEFPMREGLHAFELDELGGDFRCPDCPEFYEPKNLGDAVDWALGHKCAGEGPNA